MNRLRISILSFMAIAIVASLALAQGNPRGSAKLTLKGKTITVDYGRPSLKGRTINDLASQLKEGDVWRFGADKSTTFSTPVDLAFGDVTVPKGEYSLWVQKQGDDSWKLVFNKQHGQWGTQHDAAQDLASVPLKKVDAGKAEDLFTCSLGKEGPGGVLAAQWGDLKLAAGFTAK